MSSAFWIILTGAFVSASCAMLGCFLILRRMAMLGDAISHAILPGIVLAFYFSQSTSALFMFLGAVSVGLLTTYIVQLLSNGGVNEDAAMGVTFTSLFALGVVGVSIVGYGIDLDLDCVLYGEIAYAPLDILFIGDRSFGPRPVWMNGILFFLNTLLIVLFYKEFKICAFDADLAAAMGVPVVAMHYLLMSMVALTVVGAFENVGVILVVAMMIAPAAAAYLLTDRLSRMLIYAALCGALSSLLGYGLALWLDCSIAGAMGTVAGLLFMAAFLFSPTHGVAARWIAHQKMRFQALSEDMLLWAGRRLEAGEGRAFSTQELLEANYESPSLVQSVLKRLIQSGDFEANGRRFDLSRQGESHFHDLIQRHRIYESYLDRLGYPADHLHDAADRVEHHIPKKLVVAIDKAAKHPVHDPHGKSIPRKR